MCHQLLVVLGAVSGDEHYFVRGRPLIINDVGGNREKSIQMPFTRKNRFEDPQKCVWEVSKNEFVCESSHYAPACEIIVVNPYSRTLI